MPYRGHVAREAHWTKHSAGYVEIWLTSSDHGLPPSCWSLSQGWSRSTSCVNRTVEWLSPTWPPPPPPRQWHQGWCPSSISPPSSPLHDLYCGNICFHLCLHPTLLREEGTTWTDETLSTPTLSWMAVNPKMAAWTTHWSKGLKDRRRWPEGGGGEWEPIKISWGNLAYIPKLIRCLSLLTRPRQHSYRQAIGPRIRARNHSRNMKRC
jgi:hypothetical protein